MAAALPGALVRIAIDAMNCTICSVDMHPAFRATILGRHDVQYFRCIQCGILQTEQPYWLAEAYGTAIADTDCGLVMRNLQLSRIMAMVFAIEFPSSSRFVDIAGGYGMFTRLMRDQGFDCQWDDPHCKNILAVGCEASGGSGPVAALTAFEVLEHVRDPIAFIDDNMRRFSCRNFFFSTEVFAGDPPPLDEWIYYARETGQHISFYQERTLRAIGARLGLAHRRIGPVHALCESARSLWLPRRAWRASRLLAPVLARFRKPLTMTDHARLVALMRCGRGEPRQPDDPGTG